MIKKHSIFLFAAVFLNLNIINTGLFHIIDDYTNPLSNNARLKVQRVACAACQKVINALEKNSTTCADCLSTLNTFIKQSNTCSDCTRMRTKQAACLEYALIPVLKAEQTTNIQCYSKNIIKHAFSMNNHGEYFDLTKLKAFVHHNRSSMNPEVFYGAHKPIFEKIWQCSGDTLINNLNSSLLYQTIADALRSYNESEPDLISPATINAYQLTADCFRANIQLFKLS